MQTAKVSDYRNQLGKLHKKIRQDHDPLRVSGRDGDVVIIAAEDFENIIETLYILKDEATMRSLLEIRKEMTHGTSKGVEIGDAFKDIIHP